MGLKMIHQDEDLYISSATGHTCFTTIFFYKTVGFSLMAFAFFAIVYAIFGYVSSILIENNFSLDTLFKPIVALTLGLAIFDLAKTIFRKGSIFQELQQGK